MLARVWRQLDQACLRAFGSDLVFLPQAGGSFPFRGIFQRTAESEDASPGVYAVVFVRLDDLAGAPVRGDEIEIDATRYKIYDLETDGTGAAVLKLRRVG